MEQLAYEVTGVAAGRFADTRREIARQREQQTAAEKQQRVNRFLRGDDGKRFTSIGVNAGLGYTEATTTFMREYGQSFVLDKFLYFFANINATVPLSRNLFAEAGIDIGFSDPNNESPRYRDFHDKEEFIILDSFRLYRPYARLNIGIPVVGRRFLFLPYAGVGFDYWIETTKATYKYDGYNGYSEPREETNKSLGMDLVLGIIVNRGHHSWRMGANVSYHFDTDAWLSYQIITGYAFRF
jgi:hypothetical protein